MKPLHILSIVLIPLGLIIAFIPKQTTKPIKISSTELIKELNSKSYYYSADDVAKMLVEKDPTLVLVDVREPIEYAKYSLPGAINIPLHEIIDNKWDDIFMAEGMNTILYSNGNIESIEAWMLLRQRDIQNLYVLQGGMNYWFDAIVYAKQPSTFAADDEIAKYDFRKAAASALGMGGNDSGAIATPVVSAPKAMNPISGGKKKKGAGGGCS